MEYIMDNTKNERDFIATALNDAEAMLEGFIAYLQATEPTMATSLNTERKKRGKRKGGRR